MGKLVAGSYEINYQYDSLSEYLPLKNIIQGIEWMDTAITYNNDYFIKDWHGKLISKISPFMTDMYEFWVTNHLTCLGRSHIDIMLVHNTRHESWLKLYGMIKNDPRFYATGVSNVTIDDLKKIKETYGEYPMWVETEINPMYCDVELLEFCQNNDIKIIAYAIFGGKYNSRRYISNFSLIYLVRFASFWADKVIVRWDSEFQFNEIMRAVDAAVPIYDATMSGQFVQKSIIPDKYNIPSFIKLDKFGFPVYFNEAEVAYLVPASSDVVNFNKFDNFTPPQPLEFITEYQALMRYMREMNGTQIAIIDENGNVSKVYNKNCKVIINSTHE